MKKTWKKFLALVMAVLMMTSAVACSSSTPASTDTSDTSDSSPAGTETTTSETGDENTSKDALTIGISIDQLFSSRVATVMGLEEAGAAAGVEMIELVADGNAQTQNNQINTLIGQGVDGLLVCPVDLAAIETSLMAATAANIPVVLFDRDAPGSQNVLAFYSNDAVSDGYVGGKYLAEQLAALGLDSYKIAELRGPVNDDTANQRHDGFVQAVEEVLGDKATIVEVDTGAWDTATALANLQSSYQANPDYNAIFCGTDSFFPACETVLSDLNKMKLIGEDEHVLIVGINGSKEGYDAVVAKKCDGIVVMNCGDYGQAAMNGLLDYINNGTVPERVNFTDSSFYSYEDIEANAENIWGLWDLQLSYQ